MIFILTSLLCGAMNGDWHNDFDINDILDDITNEPKVTVTASPGFLSIYPEVLDNSNMVRVISYSSFPVDAVVKTEDGRDLLLYYGLEPLESFYFQSEDSCTITATTS